MNITGKDREGHVPPSCFPSAFVVRLQAMSTKRAECQCQFSKLSGQSASSSSVQFLRSGRSLIGAAHGSINNRGATQDAGNIVQNLGNFVQAYLAGSYQHV